ncbi:hypothetical protein [uncultured Desulfuromonas sp.]|uniref:hypothetical protein n=1 Tax=uncultured Desulfuromonas sp. TaxID=181013 RepID=UPI002AAA6ADF|nr:hypothetical protein [uncultured Desulfuromonas sp.]
MTAALPIQLTSEFTTVPLLSVSPKPIGSGRRGLSRSERSMIKNSVIGIVQQQRSVLNMLCGHGEISEESIETLVGEEGYFGPESCAERMVEQLAQLMQRDQAFSSLMANEVIDCCRRFQYGNGHELSRLSEETFQRIYEKITQRWIELPQNG